MQTQVPTLPSKTALCQLISFHFHQNHTNYNLDSFLLQQNQPRWFARCCFSARCLFKQSQHVRFHLVLILDRATSDVNHTISIYYSPAVHQSWSSTKLKHAGQWHSGIMDRWFVVNVVHRRLKRPCHINIWIWSFKQIVEMYKLSPKSIYAHGTLL